MKSEDDPVTPDEWVIRLVWTDYYDASLTLSIQGAAFSPRRDETDGSSVFLAACVANPADVLVVIAEDKRDRYAIALLPVAELVALGLTVQPAKIAAVPGHSVLPELNVVSWKADKARWRDVQKQLATLASEGVVRQPKT